ncbi:hypothetical protein A3Q56_01911 [Intoshia linei]|uniref:GATOR1 complex protein NPRL3 C-terminal HTH domain-containing protein n=1 Tax=Intoshia linei TaxID=1819745 RepID=A0A177B7U4_9BILA|nr:hypothetical protein A3Q56_01911 [Intoshia linei]
MEHVPHTIYLTCNCDRDSDVFFKYPYKDNVNQPYKLFQKSKVFSEGFVCIPTDRCVSDVKLTKLLRTNSEKRRVINCKINNVYYFGFQRIFETPYKKGAKKIINPINIISVVFAMKFKIDNVNIREYINLAEHMVVSIELEENRCLFLSRQKCISNDIYRNNGEIDFFRKSIILCKLAEWTKQIFYETILHGDVTIRLNGYATFTYIYQKKHLKKTIKYYETLLLFEPLGYILERVPFVCKNMYLKLLNSVTSTMSAYTLAANNNLPIAYTLRLMKRLVDLNKAAIIYPICALNEYIVYYDNFRFIKEQTTKMCTSWNACDIIKNFQINSNLFVYNENNDTKKNIEITEFYLKNEYIKQIFTYPVLTRFDTNLKETTKSFTEYTESFYTKEEFKIFTRISKYLSGDNKMEEIMFNENIQRSNLYIILEKMSQYIVLIKYICIYRLAGLF